MEALALHNLHGCLSSLMDSTHLDLTFSNHEGGKERQRRALNSIPPNGCRNYKDPEFLPTLIFVKDSIQHPLFNSSTLDQVRDCHHDNLDVAPHN